MKKIYEKPMLELVTFQAEESITASGLQGRALFGMFPEALIPEEMIDE